MTEVAEIHDRCREEVQHPDTYTPDSLNILRARLDLCLARGPSGRAASAPPSHRLLLALRWLEEHLENHAPSTGLCRYLQVSPATLRRLFVNALGHGPREEALRMRLEAARRFIHEENWSVKATAYHLGYRHPNDLSRLLTRSGPRARNR
jgi:transcriptional regulator GlxA family with amidase domain